MVKVAVTNVRETYSKGLLRKLGFDAQHLTSLPPSDTMAKTSLSKLMSKSESTATTQLYTSSEYCVAA